MARGLAASAAIAGLLASGPAIPQNAADAPRVLARTAPPSQNFYGAPGLIDMPSGETAPDGEFSATVSYFGGVGRYTLTAQGLPWLSASFRYSSTEDLNLSAYSTYYDRSFDVRFRLMAETRRRPAIVLGLQDFVGTGIYSAEYFAATKTFAVPGLRAGARPGALKVTGGVGWGRLGSYGSLGSPLGSRPAYDPSSTGGQLAYDQWFRGPMALFGGIEWRPDDKLAVKLEYSSDAYVTETVNANVFNRRSPINFGVEYQVRPGIRLGGYYLYGSEIGFNLAFQANPRHPAQPLVIGAPPPVQPRPSRVEAPQAWSAGWAQSEAVALGLQDRLIQLLGPQGLVVETLTVTDTTAELRYRNARYRSMPNAAGRAARAMAAVLPASVETFHMIPVSGGMPLSRTTIRRSDLEALEFDAEAAGAMATVTGYSDAPALAASAVSNPDLYPLFQYTVQPYFLPGYFDPNQPLRMDAGIEGRGSYQPAPGWTISGTLRYRLAGNIKNGPGSNSVLPRVRTDGTLYYQNDLTLLDLYASKQWRPGPDLYARVSAGYFESMFGGLSSELLWKPVASQLALGIEANYAIQRDFDQRLGFRDYSVFTGHVSGYYEFEPGLVAQVDVGRYLAGDFGATFSVDRTFDNGWSIGGFFTVTDVSAKDFGEGSFDKGIRFSIPMTWFLGQPTRQATGMTLRPIQRDGGARLIVPERLYGQIRESHRQALTGQTARFWD